MNDMELDRMLDQWQAPAPTRGMREKLRARFPRAERRVARRPWRLLAAAALAFAALAVAMGQSGGSPAGSRIAQAFMELWDHLGNVIEMHRVAALVGQIRDSDPQVSVDGKPAPPLVYRHSMVFDVQTPDGAYGIVFFAKPLSGWTRTGQIKETYIEFEAGAHHVVITCNRRLMMSDAPVQVRRR
jgi:hypothetical protein